MGKIILDLCGGTGSWSAPYKEAGYDVRLITLPDNDVREFYPAKEPVYGILAAPPCTMFSDARTNAKTPRDLKSGMELVDACLRIIHAYQYRTISDQQKYPPPKVLGVRKSLVWQIKMVLRQSVVYFQSVVIWRRL